MAELARLWSESVRSLGGRQREALATGLELEKCYAEAHRRYHTADHILATEQAASELAEAVCLDPSDRARLALAVCAHDVIYRGLPGNDEAASATWAADQLALCGLRRPDRDRVSQAVLATAGHLGPAGDPLLDCLLDADLSILGAERSVYGWYVAAVREEYAHIEERAWRSGRRAVLAALLGRSPLYRTAVGRQRWEAAARRNVENELAALGQG